METSNGAVCYTTNEVGVVQWWESIPDWIDPDYIVVLDEYEEVCK